MAPDYKGIYEALDTTLRKHCDSPSDFDRRMDETVARFDGRAVNSDDDYHWALVYVAFYSGFKAKTVTQRMPVIKEYLQGYQRVAAYDDEMVHKMLNDERMITYEKKIRASIQNARAVVNVVQQYGSFRAYLDSFDWKDSPDNLMRLRNDLMWRFDWLGPITSFHFMMDIGLPILKPDRVIMRVFERLGLTQTRSESEENLLEVVRQGLLFKEATGKPIRQIDIMFVSLGQVGGNSSDLGVTRGICLEKSPLCSECDLRDQCNFFKKLQPNPR